MHQATVLLVEDNHLLRWWMTSSLKREGWVVVATQSVDEATSLAGAYPFDVLITDWRLQDGHSGFEVLARLRATYPGIPAILISAEADADLEARARTEGFDVVIRKPFPLAEIVGAVHGLAVIHHSEGRA
jgi:DNA-binding response OmpR family regulator